MFGHRFDVPAVLALAVFSLALPGQSTAQTQTAAARKPFAFTAIGDMPYELPGKPARFERLVDAIRRVSPAFTIHVGDIISGRTQCSDENFARVRRLFARFEKPLVYTPGDNEWTDCHRFFSGGFDPLERLATIRRMFFADPERSLGRRPMRLQSQARLMAQTFARYVENRRWSHNGVVFATAHIVGSNNNLQPKRPHTLPEYAAREKANLAWIAAAFDYARLNNAAALALAWQANVHRTPRFDRSAPFSSAYVKIIAAVERGATAFGRPVLVIYGDFHKFDVRPFVNLARQPVANVTHLQVFGDSAVHAVLVKVDPGGNKVFAIEPLLVPGNPAP